MKQPTPEEWWNALTDEDRDAYARAADEAYLPADLAGKLMRANVLVVSVGFGDEANAVFPGPYREYAAAQAGKE